MTRRTAGCVSISGAAAGVVTTSTGPWRAASTSSSGVVSTTSPRKAVWMTRLVNLQDRQERLLWDLDRSHLLHALLDRKSTRLNSSHPSISYAVFCLKKKKQRQSLKSL